MVFNAELLEELNNDAVEPEWTLNLEGPGPEFPRTFEPVENLASSSFVHVWEPPEEDTAYVIGADVAEGLKHGDYSSAHVVAVGDETRVVAEWHGHIEPDLFAYELFKLGTWYNTALVLPEVNNHGLTTVTELRKLGYRRIWRRMALNSTSKKRQMEWGWKTTCLLYTSPSPRDRTRSRMPSSA